MANEITIAERYGQLDTDKNSTSTRAEDCALLTLPYAYPEENIKSQDNLNRGYTQGFGAMLVNHLVGKLALTILPPSQPFYRLSATQEAMEAVSQGNPEAKFEIEKILAQKEEGILRNINKSNLRASLYPALRLAIITGNCMLEKLEDSYRVINLRNYVVKRDYTGTVVEFIIKETLSYNTLPEEFQSKVDEDKKDEDIDLYTYVQRIENQYVLTQEILDEDVGTEEKFKKFTDRFIDIGWNKIDGEDYRRGFVEDHLGTLLALEKLTKVVFEGIAESVKIIKLVNPNGMTKYEDFTDAKHGTAIMGQGVDITEVQSGKTNDLRVAKELINEMKTELSKAFLVTGASIRDSERTTAQEVSIVANDVEASLGGIYTAISGDIQRPAVEQAMKDMKIEASKEVDVIITTGVQALGRNVEMSKINALIQELQLLGQVVGPEAVAKTVNLGAMVSSIVANSGVASKDFLYTEGQMAEIEGQAKQEQMSEQAMMSGMQTAGADAGSAAVQGAVG